MNIVVFYGQSHHGNTYRLTQRLLRALGPAQVTAFTMADIPPCVGCAQCIMATETACPHHSRIAPLLSALDGADVLIMASPTSCMGMTGQLKSFCDHLGYRWMVHRPADLRGAVGVAVSTAAGSGAGQTTRQMAEQMTWWSVGRVYRLPFVLRAANLDAVPARRQAGLERQIRRLAARIRRAAARRTPSARVRLLFAFMRLSHRKGWNAVETAYWQAQGWIPR